MFGLINNTTKKFKFPSFCIVLILFIILLCSSPQKASADYNKDLILTDAEFTDYNSMTVQQINDFLIAKGSVFANYVIPEYVEVPFPYQGGNWATVSVRQINDVTGEILYGKTVAQLIYDEVQQHQINPKVIIAIMQKESSTITQSSVSQTRLAWPLFYAFDEVMAAFGYSYEVARLKALDFGGVARQIAYATANFRAKYNTWSTQNWQAPMIIDGVTVYPQSICTRLFYIYTPHMWTNFYNIYYDWFVPAFLSFAVVKTDTSSNIYLLDEQTKTKWLFVDMKDFMNFGYYSWHLEVISDDTLAGYIYGGIITRLLKTANSPAVYYIENGRKHHIRSEKVLSLYGLSWQNLSIVSDSLVNQIPSGPPLGFLSKSPDSPAVYLLSNNQRYYVPNYLKMWYWGFKWADIETIPSSVINAYPLSKNLTILVKGPSAPVYVLLGGVRSHIPNNEVFSHWRFRWSDVITVGNEVLVNIPETKKFSRLVKGSGSRVYLVEYGKKRPFMTGSAFFRRGYSFSQVVTVPDDLLSWLKDGAPLW